MFRLLLYVMFGYLIWRVIQIVIRTMSHARREEADPFANQPPKPKQTFKDVQDAEFEELPRDEKK